jgi:purine-nucleoside phosphorylase
VSFEDLHRAATAITEATGHESHQAAVVLGSGLGSYPDGLENTTSIDYGDLPGFPRPNVEGHQGRLVSAQFGDNRVLLLAGRVHAYEGHPLDAVVFAVRSCLLAGCRTVVLTNAAGGCGPGLEPGDLVLISDHLNLSGRNPLVGANDDRLGPRFPDLSDVYNSELRLLARRAGDETGIALKEGVYAWFLGPSYETPAEVRMAVGLGADLVGMSTVPEAIAARHMGARVIGISLVTNLAAGISPIPLSHEEVQTTALAARERFASLLTALLPRL